jgi:DNA-binding response OmpR family regulator
MTTTTLNILVVEDEKVLSDIHVDAFKAAGMDCKVARDGLEALKMLKGGKYDAILMDIIMPKMNGFDLLRKLQTHPEWNKLPVIVLSNLGQDADRKLCMNLGACSYYLKTQTSQDEVINEIKKRCG